jgi:hypothetical protein
MLKEALFVILGCLESEENKLFFHALIEQHISLKTWDLDQRKKLIKIVKKWQPIVAHYSRMPTNKYLLNINPIFSNFAGKIHFLI